MQEVDGKTVIGQEVQYLDVVIFQALENGHGNEEEAHLVDVMYCFKTYSEELVA